MLSTTVRAALEVGKGALCELLARCLSAEEGVDRARAEPAQPARVIEELEALALSLTGSRRSASLVDGDPECRCNRAVSHPLGQETEHSLLSARQLAQELRDDEAVLVPERRLLGPLIILARLGHPIDAWGALGEDLPPPALVAMQVQSAVLQSPAQSVTEVLLAHVATR
jgi:hypothetical protein